MNRKRIIVSILSFLLTNFVLIGISFDFYKSLNLFQRKPFLSILLWVFSFFLFYMILNDIFKRLDNCKPKQTKMSKFKILNLLNDHPFIFSFLVLLLGWLIYVIAFYPTIMSYDPSYQILQFFGIDNKYSYYSILLDKNMIITNHHPVSHTLLLGFCAKLGLLFKNLNIGLFIYSIIQILILSLTLSYTISFMKKINISLKYRLVCLIIYTIVPVFPFYAMSPVKDVIFGCFIILYIIQIWNYICNYKIKWIKFMILLILIILFRNNGFHILILSLPFLLFIQNKNKKKLGLVIFMILTFYFSYNKIILPYFKITPSSPREMLSIPFQQTARYISSYPKEVTQMEKETIDKILEYDTIIERYNPEKSDPVKNKFNPYSTKEDLKKYFQVWFQQFKKHPMIYLESTLHNTYGYFYPPKTNWYIYCTYNDVLKKYDFDYDFNSLKHLRKMLSGFGLAFPYIPIIGLIVNIGFSTWLLLFMISYLIYLKQYRKMLYLLPSMIVLLVCFASPVNAYFRYALPTIFAMPMLLAIFKSIIENREC